MKELIVEKKYDNKKLDVFLLNTFPSFKKNVLYKALRKKDIMLNGKRIHENTTVYYQDTVRIYIHDDLLFANKKNLTIVYEDDHILLLNKPTGIEVTGSNSLTTLANQYYTGSLPCHRLDRNTSGLVLFAKHNDALTILLEKFKKHEIEKYYVAKTYGIVEKNSDTLEDYLFKDKKKSKVYISPSFKKGYQKIITSYRVLSRNYDQNTTTLSVLLQTGKTHQIRAHLAYIGHPIIGDGKYGTNEINKKFKQKVQLLCSTKIKFSFLTDSGILDYLNGKEFEIEVPFQK